MTLKKLHTFKKASFIGGFFIATQLLLSSCGREDHSDKMVFRYNEPTGIPTLDPAFARDKGTIWAVGQIYEGLFRLNEHNEVVPALAKEMHSSGATYTFTLREAYFHSGRRVKAQDVCFSFQRLVDPAIASPGAWVLERMQNIRPLNDSVVQITLDEPFSALPSLLTIPYCSVVDSLPALAGDLATGGGGSGPFKVHKWFFGEKLILHKHPAYWQKDSTGHSLPYLDGISVRFLPDQQSAFLEYLSGNLSMLPNIDPSFKDGLLTKDGALQPQYSAAHTMQRSAFLNTEFLIFNAERNLPHELRWAINAAIDREKMISLLRSGVGRPATGGIIPYGLDGFASNAGIAFDPDSAKQIIASYGTLPDVSLTTVANYRDICEFIQGSLGELGWDIAVDIVPSATLRGEKSAGTLDFFRASWIADYPDAENYLMLFASSFKAPNGPNYSRYHNAEFDAMYAQILSTKEDSLRTALLRRADEFLMEDAACVPLYYDEVIRVLPKGTKGVKTNALNALLLHEAQIVSN